MWTRLALIGVVALLVTADAVRAQDDATYARVILSADSATVAPMPGKAVVIFVRELYPRIEALPDEAVLLDGEAAGELPQRTWFAVLADSGRHVVWGVHQGY